MSPRAARAERTLFDMDREHGNGELPGAHGARGHESTAGGASLARIGLRKVRRGAAAVELRGEPTRRASARPLPLSPLR